MSDKDIPTELIGALNVNTNIQKTKKEKEKATGSDASIVFKPFYDAIEARSTYAIPNPQFIPYGMNVGILPPLISKVTPGGIIIPDTVKDENNSALGAFPMMLTNISPALLKGDDNSIPFDYKEGDFVYVSKNVKDVADKFLVNIGFDGTPVVLIVHDASYIKGKVVDNLRAWKNYARVKLDSLMGIYRMQPFDKREKCLEGLMVDITALCYDGDATTRYKESKD